MKKILTVILFGILLLSLTSWSDVKTDTISSGEQPQITSDNLGVIRIVFGQKDKIFCVTSHDKGVTFSQPVLVAQLPQMHLGMSRGPQFASSINYSVITAQDKAGNIHWYKLNHSSNKWKTMGIVNDQNGSTPEGLMGIAADKKDNFYAVWLDTRTGGNNQIYFSSLLNKAAHWSKNRLAYRSPDQHVCECCKPSIAVQGSTIAIMFRNWLNGSRDLYLTKSLDGGTSFTGAQKLGMDTWKLNGCPMDGGGIAIDGSNVIRTTWQRKGNVYYAQPGDPEINIGSGRNCNISGTGNNAVLTFQNNDTVKVLSLKNKNVVVVGKGSFLKTVVLANNKILCVWEQDNEIKFKRI
jgi:hypothetical protein